MCLALNMDCCCHPPHAAINMHIMGFPVGNRNKELCDVVQLCTDLGLCGLRTARAIFAYRRQSSTRRR